MNGGGGAGDRIGVHEDGGAGAVTRPQSRGEPY